MNTAEKYLHVFHITPSRSERNTLPLKNTKVYKSLTKEKKNRKIES